jgi:hypothetical protein
MERTARLTGRIFILLLLITLGTTLQARSQSQEPQTPATQGEATLVHLPMVNKYFPWTSPFAIESNKSLAEGSFHNEELQALKPSWVRINDRVSWANLQPEENGPIQWGLLAGLDKELRALRAAGIKPILIVDSYPSWATIVPNGCSALRPDKYDDFANFVVALVERYNTMEFNVKNWELGNEIDVDPILVPVNSEYGCWGDISDLAYYGGDHYGEMIKVAGSAIKAADPTARVWIGGLILNSPDTPYPETYGKPENFLRGVLAVGAAPYFDVVPYHAHTLYYGRNDEVHLTGPWAVWGGGLVGKANYLRALMQEYGVTKTLSLNEIGVGCRDDFSFCVPEPVPEFFDFQADMIVRLAVRAVGADLESFVWFTLDGPGWREMGLLDGTTRRPSFYAYQTLIKQTMGATYSAMAVYGEGIDAFAFTSSDRGVQVVWTALDANLPFTVPQATFVEALDREGNPITPTVVGDSYQFTATFSPIYIITTH